MTSRRRDEIEAVREFGADIGPADPDSQEAARRLLVEAIDAEGGRQRTGPERSLKLKTLGLLAGLLVIPATVALAGGIAGDLASQVVDSAGRSIGVDPASCPETVAALTAAGIPEDEQPTVYAGRCPTSSELDELVPGLRELRDRRRSLGR